MPKRFGIQFGIFLGDIVWESNEESWNNVDNDIIEIGKPIFFAAGNHDIENRTLFLTPKDLVKYSKDDFPKDTWELIPDLLIDQADQEIILNKVMKIV